MLSITIEWLVGKWRGTIEDVARSRISNQGELKVGEVVHIEHRRGQHEARIVALGVYFSFFGIIFYVNIIVLL